MVMSIHDFLMDVTCIYNNHLSCSIHDPLAICQRVVLSMPEDSLYQRVKMGVNYYALLKWYCGNVRRAPCQC